MLDKRDGSKNYGLSGALGAMVDGCFTAAGAVQDQATRIADQVGKAAAKAGEAQVDAAAASEYLKK